MAAPKWYPPTRPERTGQLVEHDGHLAQFRMDWLDKEQPIHHVRLGVATRCKAEDYQDLIGAITFSTGRGWDGTYRNVRGRYVEVRATDWPTVVVDYPVPKPKDGRTYTWAWRDGHYLGWHVVEYPVCRDCDQQHAPTYAYCESCYRCHKVGGTCR